MWNREMEIDFNFFFYHWMILGADNIVSAKIHQKFKINFSHRKFISLFHVISSWLSDSVIYNTIGKWELQFPSHPSTLFNYFGNFNKWLKSWNSLKWAKTEKCNEYDNSYLSSNIQDFFFKFENFSLISIFTISSQFLQQICNKIPLGRCYTSLPTPLSRNPWMLTLSPFQYALFLVARISTSLISIIHIYGQRTVSQTSILVGFYFPFMLIIEVLFVLFSSKRKWKYRMNFWIPPCHNNSRRVSH